MTTGREPPNQDIVVYFRFKYPSIKGKSDIPRWTTYVRKYPWYSFFAVGDMIFLWRTHGRADEGEHLFVSERWWNGEQLYVHLDTLDAMNKDESEVDFIRNYLKRNNWEITEKLVEDDSD